MELHRPNHDDREQEVEISDASSEAQRRRGEPGNIEQALRESEERYRHLVEYAPIAIVVHARGRIVFVNPEAVKILGASSEADLLGRAVMDFVHPDYREIARQRIQAIYERGEPAELIEEKLIRLDGEVIDVEVAARRIDYQGEPASQVVLRDITRRKRAEEALRVSERKYRDLFENANDIIYTHDLEGNFTSVNQRAEQLTGYTREEILRMNIADVVVPEDLDRARHMIQHKLHQEQLTTTYELTILNKGGRQLPVEVSTRLLYQEGRPTEVLGIARDITARKQLEAVSERAQQQERLAAVGQLAAGIAHDFNNILTGIIGYSEMLLNRDGVSEQCRPYAQAILQQGERAAQLIRQILDFSRQSHPMKQPLDLLSFLKEGIKLLQRTIPENIAIVFEGRGSYVVKADPVQIQEVVTNLVVNARDAMPKGGEIRIQLAHRIFQPGEPVPFRGMENRPWVLLAVSDTGCGIAPEVQPHIFEPFFTTKPRGQGTGLGLAQVYGIVKQHDGFIFVESEVGRGTTFRIYLPAEASEASALRVESQETPPPTGNGELILVVEDEPAVLDVIREILTSLGYRVLSARNGREALHLYERQPEVALVLSDWVMPEMGGIELFRELRRRHPKVRGVLMSGYPPQAEQRRQMEQEGIGWIQKPISLAKLARVVHKELHRE